MTDACLLKKILFCVSDGGGARCCDDDVHYDGDDAHCYGCECHLGY